jgi:hypothetical protein
VIARLRPLQAFAICLLISACVASRADNTITQNNYGGGENIILFGKFAPKYRLAFSSQPSYTGSLAPFAQIDNPNRTNWMRASGKTTNTKPLSAAQLDLAYTRFLQGKAELEQDPCIARQPVGSVSSPSSTASDTQCTNLGRSINAIEFLEESFSVLPNAWTRLYRGIGYARLRAFTPAERELSSAEKQLRHIGVEFRAIMCLVAAGRCSRLELF